MTPSTLAGTAADAVAGGLPAGTTFHHVGVACTDLDAETELFRWLGYAPEGDDFTDPVQGVRGRFLSGGGPRLELLVGCAEDSVLAPWLKGGTKLYHLAFETPDLDEALRALRAARARVVVQPVPAVAFGGRRIAFAMLRNLLLIELIGGD